MKIGMYKYGVGFGRRKLRLVEIKAKWAFILYYRKNSFQVESDQEVPKVNTLFKCQVSNFFLKVKIISLKAKYFFV
jgi:hypothetical protein